MTGLVKRLRDYELEPEDMVVRHEAADEIERLHGQLELMAAANRQLSKALERAINGYSGA